VDAPATGVRGAAPGDAEAIARVHVRTWQEAYVHLFGAEALAGLDVGRRAEWWRRAVATPGYAVFVAESDGAVVAFASIGPSSDPDAGGELYAIYAVPEAWGTGVGPALMRDCVDALRAAGHDDAVLWVFADNPRARRFYEREGWRLDGTSRDGEHFGVRTAEVRYRLRL